MIKRPNFYMLCIIKTPELRHRLIIPLPLFLVDEILEVAGWAAGLLHFSSNRMGLKNVDVKQIVRTVEKSWRTIRQAGSFTLVEVEPGDGTKINIRMI